MPQHPWLPWMVALTVGVLLWVGDLTAGQPVLDTPDDLLFYSLTSGVPVVEHGR